MKHVKYRYLIVILLTFMLFIPKGNTYWNGSGGMVRSNGISTCNSSVQNSMCAFDNRNRPYFKVTLFYYDSTEYIENVLTQCKRYKTVKKYYPNLIDQTRRGKIAYLVGDYNYFTNSLNVKNNSNQIVIDASKIYSGGYKEYTPKVAGDFYKQVSDKFQGTFGNDLNQCKNVNCIKNSSAAQLVNLMLCSDGNGKLKKGCNYTQFLTQESDVATPNVQGADTCSNIGRAAKKGYRLVFEPVLYYNYYNGGTKGGYLYTPKEAAVSHANNEHDFRQNSIHTPLTHGYIDKGAYAGNPWCGSPACWESLPQSQYFYTKFWDVGINSGQQAGCTNVSVDALASLNNGCGYNIIDVGKLMDIKKCYVRKTEGDISCKDGNGNYLKDVKNEKHFTEKYEEVSCADVEEGKDGYEKEYTEDGKLIVNNSRCKMHCIEEADVVFPTSLTRTSTTGEKIGFGSYFPWPTKVGGRMPLTITMKYVCKAEGSCNDDDYNAAKNKLKEEAPVSANLNAGDNDTIAAPLTKIENEPIMESKGGKLIFSREVGLEIGEDTNRFYNKITNKVTSVRPNGIPYLDRKEGVVSLKPFNLQGETFQIKQYELKLSKVQIGNIKTVDDYTCKLEISGSCTCPQGTNMHGLDLSEIENASGKSCAELQQTACNCACPIDSGKPGELYDSEKAPNGYKNITGLKGQDMVNACQNWQRTYCYPCVDKSTGEKRDISNCIIEKENEYKTTYSEERAKERAKEYCNQKYCPPYCDDSNGNHIDLSDCMYKEGKSYLMCYNEKCNKMPCPSGICVDAVCTEGCKWTYSGGKYGKYIKKCSNQGGKDNCGYINNACGDEATLKGKLSMKLGRLSITDGLDENAITPADVRAAIGECAGENKRVVFRTVDLQNPFPGASGDGRTPGENWNSKSIVENELIKARGATGYGLYNKEPLYTITLTPNTINKIKKYNESNNYSDFNLDCENDSKCVSTYLQELKREGIITSQIDACRNTSSKFDECYNGKN